MPCAFCCCSWKCCEHNILFCDQDEPCSIDLLPQNRQEEDLWDDMDEEAIRERGEKEEFRRRLKWRLKRYAVRCCTFYWRFHPCNCFGGNVSRWCNSKRQPSPRTALRLISTIKMLLCIAGGIYYWTLALQQWNVYSHERGVREGEVPRGLAWGNPVLNDTEKEDLYVREYVNKRRAFCSSASSLANFLLHFILYFLLFVSATCLSLCAGFTFILLWIVAAACVIAQPVIYDFLHRNYVWTDADGTRRVVDVVAKEGGEVYWHDLYTLWGLSLALFPYELWILIWHLRAVKVSRLKREGVIVEDSSDALLDVLDQGVGPMEDVFLFEHLHPNLPLPSSMTLASYNQGNQVLTREMSMSEMEIQWEDGTDDVGDDNRQFARYQKRDRKAQKRLLLEVERMKKRRKRSSGKSIHSQE